MNAVDVLRTASAVRLCAWCDQPIIRVDGERALAWPSGRPHLCPAKDRR